jgi:hypothetical protein
VTPADRAQLRLQELASRLEPALRAAFLRVVAALRPDQITDLVRRMEAGDIAGAVDLVFGRPEAVAAVTAMRATFAQSLIRLTQATTRDLSSSLRLTIAAPVASPDLIAAVRRWEDGAFARVLADTRAGLRETIATELQRGIGPRQVAVALKGDISFAGLTDYDARIIRSFREALEEGRVGDALQRTLRDRRFDRALSGRPLTPAEIEKMVAAYRRKLVAFRAETFARTAAMQAANEASAIGWREAIAQGAIPATEVKRYWVVAQDERLCKVCAPIPSMNPDGVGLDEPFMTPKGPMRSAPAHANCRCATYVRRERPNVRRAPQPGTTRLILPQLVTV